MMWWADGMGWGGWVVMTLTMLAFWSFVVLAVVAAIRGDRENRTTGAPRERDPLQVLDERFARGDIEGAEYSARRAELRTAR